jgi:hypothetical protein
MAATRELTIRRDCKRFLTIHLFWSSTVASLQIFYKLVIPNPVNEQSFSSDCE